MMRALVACVALAGLAADAIAQRVVEGPEPNASAATATLLPLGAEAAGVLASAGDADWFALTVPAGVRLRIESAPGVGAQARDTGFTRLDAAGAPGTVPYELPGNKPFHEAAKGLVHCLVATGRLPLARNVCARIGPLDPADPLGIQRLVPPR